MTWPHTERPLTLTERRTLKRRLGAITDRLTGLDQAERDIQAARVLLQAERDKLMAQVYRS